MYIISTLTLMNEYFYVIYHILPQFLCAIFISGSLDDDVCSVSAASMVSSCSLASQVLERAKNRRDKFWTSRS